MMIRDPFALIECDDGVRRPQWANQPELMREYFDSEWGQEVRDEAGVFERLMLEVFQSGLSWLTILRRREGIREVFEGFDIDVLAAWTDDDVERALLDERIIRNRLKVQAARTNARAAVELRSTYTDGVAGLIWEHSIPAKKAGKPLEKARRLEIPVTTPASDAAAKALKARGFTFVGPVNVCAGMCAIGAIPVLTYGK
ncbi:DNA-3-methyladenine glycosylase I [Ruaniaceae bacterium KH17]|nr:DNA-3-methyladenine glycosylase I [Ruaniaceae bacterium KH17]